MQIHISLYIIIIGGILLYNIQKKQRGRTTMVKKIVVKNEKKETESLMCQPAWCIDQSTPCRLNNEEGWPCGCQDRDDPEAYS